MVTPLVRDRHQTLEEGAASVVRDRRQPVRGRWHQ